MTIIRNNVLQTGSDPRALAEFCALRQEMASYDCPGGAGPDWPRVEQLAIALFRINGMDLQSVAWYTLARAHCAGLAGLCEGFEIVTAMMKHQWPTLWPQPLSARLAIITLLSTGLQQVLHEIGPEERDRELLTRLQTQLEQNIETLEQLAHKHLSQLDRLAVQIDNILTRLTQPPPAAEETVLGSAVAKPGSQTTSSHYEDFTPLIYVPRDLTTSTALNVNFSFWEQSRSFFAGMVVAAVLGALGIWAYQLAQPQPPKAQRIAMLAQQITPEQMRENQHWQRMAAGAALPEEQLLLWYTARLRLQKLIALSQTPEQLPGGPLSHAELKAQLVTIQQPLEAMLPVEELLRQLAADKPSAVLRGKIEHRIKQQLFRYALILDDDWQSQQAQE